MKTFKALIKQVDVKEPELAITDEEKKKKQQERFKNIIKYTKDIPPPVKPARKILPPPIKPKR